MVKWWIGETIIYLLLLLLCAQLIPEYPFCPYYTDTGEFEMNYTGAHINGNPSVVLSLDTDGLDVDSLLQIYPAVSVLDSLTFWAVIEREISEESN